MDQPNILLMVWDACRYDYAAEHASYLKELASSSIWFEKAVAPSPWSLPSHASVFTGEHPHEHGRNCFGDSIDTPLVTELSNKGYTCYGISANSFASQRTGFHEDFDEFRYTGGRDLYIDGMDVSGTAQGILRDEGGSHKAAMFEVLKQIPRNDHRLRSLANLFSVTCGELATKVESLQRIPHPTFAPTSDYSYSPEKNTRVLESVLEDHDQDKPFFVFMNYMDTHRCYKPPDDRQEKHIGKTLGYRELVRLNEKVAAPWEFERRKALDELDEEDVEDLRGLYAGEVETVDSHLKRVHELLETEGLLDDTLLVVTSDHGENLGEVDEMGRRRMGHEASVSDAVLRVPLLIANPRIEPRRVEERVSLESLYDLFVEDSSDLLAAGGEDLSALLPEDGAVFSQYPATGGEQLFEKYPEAPEETIRNRVSEDSAVAYEDGHKVVAESTGERWSRCDEENEKRDETCERLMRTCEEHLEALRQGHRERSLSDEEVSQLEALGYM